MTKNNSNWKEIEEEFIQNFLVYFQDQRLEDPTIGVENGNTGIDALIVNDQIQKRAMNKANRVLNFFKPYFQEKMHGEAVDELEKPCIKETGVCACHACFADAGKKIWG